MKSPVNFPCYRLTWSEQSLTREEIGMLSKKFNDRFSSWNLFAHTNVELSSRDTYSLWTTHGNTQVTVSGLDEQTYNEMVMFIHGFEAGVRSYKEKDGW